MCTQHTCIMRSSCEYIEHASCIQEQWFMLLNSLIRNFLTFFMFLVNSLCLTGRVWNKFCKETVVPVYMGEKEYTHVEMLCYGSCSHPPPHLSGTASLGLNMSIVVIFQASSHTSRAVTRGHTKVTAGVGQAQGKYLNKLHKHTHALLVHIIV